MTPSPRSRAGGRAEPLLRHVIGGILRRARLAQGRTLVDVAAAARVSTAYLSEVERGRKEASSEVLAAVCGALGLRLVDLVARTGEELRPLAPVRVLSSARERGALSAPRHVAPVGEPVRDLPRRRDAPTSDGARRRRPAPRGLSGGPVAPRVVRGPGAVRAATVGP